MRSITVFVALAMLSLTGCVTYARKPASPRRYAAVRPTPPPTENRTPRESALYDGRTGRMTSLDAFAASARNADVVFFGELHGHLVGARYQMDLLQRMGTQGRPVALAMEFFEADVQEDLDLYLDDRINEVTFRERTRRSGAYEKTHGPLVLWAKESSAPVLAANAPRKLVSGYRKFDGKYGEYLESLSEEERAWMPRRTSTPEDEYWKRFEKMMGGGERAANFFRSQALWDDAMAESIAELRATNPDTRVLMIVGGFHVDSWLGTITKYRQRRPQDRIALLVMNADDDPTLPFQADDRGSGDVVLKVGPPKRERPSGPNPHAAP